MVFRIILKLLMALTLAAFASGAFAQQSATPASPPTARAAAQTVVAPQSAPVAEAQMSTAATPQTTSVTSAADGAVDGHVLKSAVPVLHELSPWSMFLSADIIVKAVMIGLAFASLVTWTIFVAKMIELAMARRKLGASLKTITESRSLAEAQFAVGSKAGVLSAFLASALREARLSAGISSDSGVKERAASSFAEISRAEARHIRLGMGLLATIGSTSPFVGLFGTVWGIMNSFIGISKAQTTNLAVVAPGIAEALLATAIGLAAAIPAVIIYNYFARKTKTYLELVARASGTAARLLSRDLDRGDLDRGHGVVLARAAE